MANKALLIIDMLNDFVKEGAPLEVPNTRKIIPSIQKERERAHREGIPVIYVCDSHESDDEEFTQFGWPAHAVQGTPGAQVISQLNPSEKDIIIHKKSYSGFLNTRLESTLNDLNIDTVRLTGCVTNICVLFIAYEAAIRGYAIEVVAEGVAGLATEDHEAALRIMKNVLRAQIV